jgi:hypothetical protein
LSRAVSDTVAGSNKVPVTALTADKAIGASG